MYASGDVHPPTSVPGREADLHAWSSLLLLFGGIFLAGHLLTFALIQTEQPRGLISLSRTSALLLGGMAFWFFRRRDPLPAGASERQVWLIWLGALVAYGTSSLVSRLQRTRAFTPRGCCSPTGSTAWGPRLRWYGAGRSR